MTSIVGIYFSGTGNTRHCVEYFIEQCEPGSNALSIENPAAVHAISNAETIVLGYPVYFSNAPKILQDFLTDNHTAFSGKAVYLIATMGLFSGDGTGCVARILCKYGASIRGGLHLKMPDCIGDEKALKKSVAENRALVLQAEEKNRAAAARLKAANPHREGLSFLSHLAGLFGQRLWFYGKTTSYKCKPKVDTAKCTGCSRCASLCPMKNIVMAEGKAVSGGKCTLCYRCFGHCPSGALTILGKTVYEQCLIEKYR